MLCNAQYNTRNMESARLARLLFGCDPIYRVISRIHRFVGVKKKKKITDMLFAVGHGGQTSDHVTKTWTTAFFCFFFFQPKLKTIDGSLPLPLLLVVIREVGKSVYKSAIQFLSVRNGKSQTENDSQRGNVPRGFFFFLHYYHGNPVNQHWVDKEIIRLEFDETCFCRFSVNFP